MKPVLSLVSMVILVALGIVSIITHIPKVDPPITALFTLGAVIVSTLIINREVN